MSSAHKSKQTVVFSYQYVISDCRQIPELTLKFLNCREDSQSICVKDSTCCWVCSADIADGRRSCIWRWQKEHLLQSGRSEFSSTRSCSFSAFSDSIAALYSRLSSCINQSHAVADSHFNIFNNFHAFLLGINNNNLRCFLCVAACRLAVQRGIFQGWLKAHNDANCTCVIELACLFHHILVKWSEVKFYFDATRIQ